MTRFLRTVALWWLHTDASAAREEPAGSGSASGESANMEAAVFILSLVDCCALIFLSVYFVSFRKSWAEWRWLWLRTDADCLGSVCHSWGCMFIMCVLLGLTEAEVSLIPPVTGYITVINALYISITPCSDYYSVWSGMWLHQCSILLLQVKQSKSGW